MEGDDVTVVPRDGRGAVARRFARRTPPPVFVRSFPRVVVVVVVVVAIIIIVHGHDLCDSMERLGCCCFVFAPTDCGCVSVASQNNNSSTTGLVPSERQVRLLFCTLVGKENYGIEADCLQMIRANDK